MANTNVGQLIKKLRTERGMTQEELGEILGVKKAAVQKWESGTVQNLKRATIQALSEYFGVSPSSFIEGPPEPSNVGAIYTDEIYQVPVFESVSAGFGAYADSQIVEYIPLYIRNPSDAPMTMAIKVQGDSMYPKIEDGDLIVVRKQSSVDSGSIAVLLLDGEEALVKKVEYGKDWIDLISINPMYPVRHFKGEDVTRLRVLGLVKQIIKNV